MAKPCPACGRPNGDGASECLYCSAPFTASVPDVSRQEPVAPTQELAPPSDWHLVILIPSGAPDDRMIEGLANAVRVSRYDARLGLSAMRPRVFRRVDGEAVARTLSEQLKASSIPHYVVSESSIRALPVYRAQNAELKAGHLVVTLDGRALSVSYREMLLLVRGEIARESHNENKIASKKGGNRALSPGLLLHLYSKDASVAIEVDPEIFTWSGGDATQSALLKLEQFLDAVRAKTPGLTVDRAFDLELPVLSRSSSDGTDLAQVLAAGAAPGGVLYDNQEQFRFYARWRYRLERHLRRATEST